MIIPKIIKRYMSDNAIKYPYIHHIFQNTVEHCCIDKDNSNKVLFQFITGDATVLSGIINSQCYQIRCPRYPSSTNMFKQL